MVPFIRAATAATALLVSAAALAQEETPVAAGGVAVVEAAEKTVSLIVWVLLLLILLPVAFLVYRKVYQAMVFAREAPATRIAPDPMEEARRLELRGDFVGAAQFHEATGNLVVAAALLVKGKEFARAAEVYEALGDLEQSIACHLKSGGSLKAAGLYVRMGNYMEAAKIFRNKGDFLRAGQALEKFGNRLGAARAYETAGEFARAARLLREEGMHAEAAELFEQILAVNPGHAKARAHLAKRQPPEAAPAGEPSPVGDNGGSAGREIDEAPAMAEEPVDPMRSLTLRQMTSRTRFEPRYSMRLWLQMLKALAELHRSGVYFGTITPDSISVDMTNTVAIVPAATPDPDYQAPEVAAGARPDEAADIYAMGCILYEMLTGSPEGKGVWPPSKIRDDVPDWLDFLVAKCLASDRTARYRSLDELSAAIVALKTGG